MPRKPKGPDPKTKALRRRGSLNPRADEVTDPQFGEHDFFDGRDLVQVKYEMLRRVRVDGWSITGSASAFGLSRPSFYKAQSAFERGGLGALLPDKPGPRRSHKLSPEVMAFVEQLRTEDPSVRVERICERVFERFGRKVHPRSVERALAREKKKRY